METLLSSPARRGPERSQLLHPLCLDAETTRKQKQKQLASCKPGPVGGLGRHCPCLPHLQSLWLFFSLLGLLGGTIRFANSLGLFRCLFDWSARSAATPSTPFS